MLDIIIPTYKNKKGLKTTLASINQDLLSEIKVSVIDDCSEEYYNDILEQFPFFTIYYLDKNQGPGMARQMGIDITHEPYLMFIDTGDIFISFDAQIEMLETIKNNPEIYMYYWPYYHKEKLTDFSDNRLHGRVYNREFIDKYGIYFSKEGSYYDEDIGFNRTCRILLKNFEAEEPKILYSSVPLLKWILNPESLTQKDNNKANYTCQNIGLAINTIHSIKILRANQVDEFYIQEEIGFIMAYLYYWFIITLHERPEYLSDSWKGAKFFYDKMFSTDFKNDDTIMTRASSAIIKKLFVRRKKWKFFKTINYNKFLNDLKKYTDVPSWYTINKQGD